MDMEMDVTT
jgi:hypothetical protein